MTSKLADHLRAMSDEGLGALLQLRPDLLVPVPSDLSALASRAQGRASVAHALDHLDQFTLEVLDGLRLVRLAGSTAAVEALLALAAEAGVEPSEVRAAVDRLRARLLVYGPDTALHLVPAIDELTSPYPVGLGRPAADLDAEASRLVEDPARLRRTLLSAPPQARAVLDRLAAGPPVGSVNPDTLHPAKATGATGATGEEQSPVAWLVSHQLLVAIADDLVELPREVGVILRRDTGPLGPLHPRAPTPDARASGDGRSPAGAGVDSAGAGQALEAVGHLDALLHAVAETPAPVLRSFGLGVRDLRRLARQTGTPQPVAALLLEIGYAAGMLAHTEPSGPLAEQVWLPSPLFDAWRAESLAAQWALLARTWLTTRRTPAMVGQRDEKDKLVNALSYEASRIGAPALRRESLGVLAGLPDGTGMSADAVVAHLSWQAPRRMGRPGPAMLARAALSEAASLGVTGLDAMTRYGRLLLTEATQDPDDDPLGIRTGRRPDALAAAIDPLLPAPVDHVLVQADLTVVVPGPPEPALSAELALLAEAESRGGATVYRVTKESIREALDAGYAASDIHALFRRRARTPLPQALEYLIDDVARRHGGLRVGRAGCYLRSDDETLVGEVLADRQLVDLALRRLAPTVLATPHPSSRVLELLRHAGYAPVPEDATGAAVLTRPASLRAPARQGVRGARLDDVDLPRPHGPRLAAVVEQIRLGDRQARASRRSPLTRALVDAAGAPLSPAQAHTQALAVLQQAMRDQALVWVGYVDAHGGAAARLVRPVSIGAGFLRAEDDRTETVHTFALHRITSAVVEE